MRETQLASALITRPPRRVLFLCVHNSARSQMAEAWARSLGGPELQVWSAGSEPTRVHPHAIAAMQEVGIDLTHQASKGLDSVPWKTADTVVTVCGEGDEVCPRLAADVRRVHWPLPDPTRVEGPESLEAFRQARDELRWRVASLLPRGD